MGVSSAKSIGFNVFDPGPGDPGGSREAPEKADAVNKALLQPYEGPNRA